MLAIGMVLGAAICAVLSALLAHRTATHGAEATNAPATGRVDVDDLPVGVLVFEETGVLLACNNAVATTLGLMPEHRIERAEDLADLDLVDIHGSPLSFADVPVAQALSGSVITDRVVGRELADGSRRWALVNTSAVVAADGERRIIVTVCDVSGRIEQLSETLVEASRLRHQALYDGLTGLPNRTLLMDRLSKAGDRAARRNTATALLVIDLDGFKAVNDSLGHAAGDEVLVQVALRLRSALRNEDTAVRLGGDEFVVLCEDLTPDGAIEAANLIADRMRKLLSRPYLTTAGHTTTDASLGLAVAEPGAPVDMNLLHNADDTMLQDKRDRDRARGDRIVPAPKTTTATALRHAGECSRVFIVDDDAAMRLLASRIIEVDGNMTVVGEAADGDAAIGQILKTKPDIVLCDVMMPGTSGPEVVRAVRAVDPSQLFAFWSATTVNHLEKHFRSLGVPYVKKDRIDELPTRLADVVAGLTTPANTPANTRLKPPHDWADTTVSNHPAILPRP